MMCMVAKCPMNCEDCKELHWEVTPACIRTRLVPCHCRTHDSGWAWQDVAWGHVHDLLALLSCSNVGKRLDEDR